MNNEQQAHEFVSGNLEGYCGFVGTRTYTASTLATGDTLVTDTWLCGQPRSAAIHRLVGDTETATHCYASVEGFPYCRVIIEVRYCGESENHSIHQMADELGGRGVASARVPLGLNTSPHISEPTSEPEAVPPDTIWIAGGEHLPKGKDAALFTTCPEDDSDISYTRTSTNEVPPEAGELTPHSIFLLLDEFEDAQDADYHIGKKRQLAEFIATALARWEGKGESG